jgi:putative membrane protein
MLAAIAVLATNARAQTQNVGARAQTQNVTVSSVPMEDEFFVMKAYADGIAEVAKSQLAMQRATQPAIREFAERMVREHTECDNKLVEMARTKRIALPATIDAVQTACINRLAALSGSDFDKAYIKAQMCAHECALQLFEKESCKGEDKDIKDMAAKAIPTLQGHAKSAFELGGEQAEYKKFCKIQDYAKQVKAEK